MHFQIANLTQSNYRLFIKFKEQPLWGIQNLEFLKFASADFTHGGKGSASYNQKTTEFNVNYVMKQFKARIMTFVRDTRYDKVRPNAVQIGVGLQIQM